jgi:hypothetical protein
MRKQPTCRSLLAATTVLASLALVLSGTSSATARSQGDHDGHHGSRSTVALPDGLQPEGIESGPGTRYYVGSVADGRIVTGDLRRGSSTVLLPAAAGRSIRGLFLDRRSHLLWAVGSVGADAHVWAVQSRTGAVVRDVAVPGGGFLNDLVVTRDDVWVTDSQRDRLTRIALGRRGSAGSSAPTFVPLGGAWPQAVPDFSANGIRSLGRGHVVLNNSGVGGLWDVDTRTGLTRQIQVTGSPAVTSGDGLERRGSTLWNVRGTGGFDVTQLRLSYRHGTWSARVTRVLTSPTLDVPSTATVVGNALYAVNARFGVASPATAPYWITRLPLRH